MRRLERLNWLQLQLNQFARSDRAVATAVVAPLLEKLGTEVRVRVSVGLGLGTATQWHTARCQLVQSVG